MNGLQNNRLRSSQTQSKWVKPVSRQATASPSPKRQRSGALQNLSAHRPSSVNAKRLGVRQSSAAFSPAQEIGLISHQKIKVNQGILKHFFMQRSIRSAT